LNLYPNDYLVWQVLIYGINNGYQIFDFGGAGKPEVNYGPREFKEDLEGNS
jgi:lipid II:glycine glycyltransferase (peptidoglycan interpeptide bridge formation enzyme)